MNTTTGIVEEVKERFNEWLRNAATVNGATVYKPFGFVSSRCYGYSSYFWLDRPEGKIYGHLSTGWEYICWLDREDEAANEDGLVGEWCFRVMLNLELCEPSAYYDSDQGDGALIELVRDRMVMLTGIDGSQLKPDAEKSLLGTRYKWDWSVPQKKFSESLRVQLV